MVQGVKLEFRIDVEIFGGIERGEFGNGNFVRGHGADIRFGKLLLVLAALNAPRNSDFIPHCKIFHEARVPSPSDTRDIVGLVIGAVDGNEYVGNLAVERRGAVDGRFANISAE